MNLIKITDLTGQLGLSSRTLRYYEQVGLIESIRLPSETYRYYDAFSVQRLQQIMILRKMQIPVKEILHIYENPEISTLVEAFTAKIAEIDREVTALSELKEIINTFLQKMTEKGIKKISALPLLYEEMEKQELLRKEQGSLPRTQGQAERIGSISANSSRTEQKNSVLHHLDYLQEQLSAPLETAIVLLPPMRVLTSCLKQSPGESDNSDLYKRCEMWNHDNGNDLEALGGGFNVTLEALQDKQRRGRIAAKLREFAQVTEEIRCVVYREIYDTHIMKEADSLR